VASELIVTACGQFNLAAGFTERFSKYGSAKDAFKFWAGKFRYLLDKTHGVN